MEKIGKYSSNVVDIMAIMTDFMVSNEIENTDSKFAEHIKDALLEYLHLNK